MPAGRPPKFDNIEQIQEAIDKYFADNETSVYINTDGVPVREPLTITGLALALGMTRKTLMEYEKDDEFGNTIKIAKTRVEHYAEKRIFSNSPTGAIFALKNYGWSDKSEQDINQRYVNKQGDDLTSEDLKILADYEKRIKGVTKNSSE